MQHDESQPRIIMMIIMMQKQMMMIIIMMIIMIQKQTFAIMIQKQTPTNAARIGPLYSGMPKTDFEVQKF